MNKHKRSCGRASFVVFSSLLVVFVLALIDNQVAYRVKMLLKVVLIALLLGCDRFLWRENVLLAGFRRPKILLDRLTLLLALGTVIVLVGVFAIARPYLNLSSIQSDIIEKYQISPHSYLYYGLYLAIVNAFLEELLFRGFIFLSLWQQGWRWRAMLYSALLFSGYHLVVIVSWASPLLLLLLLVGLVGAALLFNLLTLRSQSYLNAYCLHGIADLVLVGIGFFILNWARAPSPG